MSVDTCLSLMSAKCKIDPKKGRFNEIVLDGLYAPESRMDRALEIYNNNIYTPIFILLLPLLFRVLPTHIREASFVHAITNGLVGGDPKSHPHPSQNPYAQTK